MIDEYMIEARIFIVASSQQEAEDSFRKKLDQIFEIEDVIAVEAKPPVHTDTL